MDLGIFRLGTPCTTSAFPTAKNWGNGQGCSLVKLAMGRAVQGWAPIRGFWPNDRRPALREVARRTFEFQLATQISTVLFFFF